MKRLANGLAMLFHRYLCFLRFWAVSAVFLIRMVKNRLMAMNGVHGTQFQKNRLPVAIANAHFHLNIRYRRYPTHTVELVTVTHDRNITHDFQSLKVRKSHFHVIVRKYPIHAQNRLQRPGIAFIFALRSALYSDNLSSSSLTVMAIV